MGWVLAAAGSAAFAGLTSILAKCGIRRCDSDVATALRTCVVLVFAWLMAAVTVGPASLGAALGAISGRSYLFLALSGLATGASWICYFGALSSGDVNKVVPIDKSSAALSALLAIVLFGETGHLGVKLVGIAVVFVGTVMMAGRRDDAAAEGGVRGAGGHRWLVLEGVDSNLATAVRTCVVAVMAWAIVAGRGKLPLVRQVEGRELAFLVASGVATGASWLLYYYAVQTGQVSVVVQIDKLSILVSVAFARVVFGERLSRTAAVGLALVVAGTLAMTVWS